MRDFPILFFVEKKSCGRTGFEGMCKIKGVYCAQNTKWGMRMELPKNIVQIGKPDKTHKIFVEDYVVSYIKQLNRVCDDKAVGLALYGRLFEENDCRYYFLYGAAPIMGLEHRGPYLSQVEKEEIADVGKRYFDEYEFLAWCNVKGEPIEGFYVQVQGKGIEIGGYACFYEKNECMLNYMLLTGGQHRSEKAIGEQKEKEKPARGEWKAADYVKPPEKAVKKKPPVAKRLEYGKVAVAAVLLILCVVGITTLNDYDKLEDLQVAARQVIASMSEQKLPDAQPTDSAAGQSGQDGTAGPDGQDGTAGPENPGSVSGQESGGTPASGHDLVSGNAGTGAAQPGQKMPQAEVAAPAAGNSTDSSPAQEDAAEKDTAQEDAAEKDTAQDGTAGEDAAEEALAEQPVATAYTIVKGDTLHSICMKKYGSLARLQEICEMNGIVNADSIQVGQTILLP